MKGEDAMAVTCPTCGEIGGRCKSKVGNRLPANHMAYTRIVVGERMRALNRKQEQQMYTSLLAKADAGDEDALMWAKQQGLR